MTELLTPGRTGPNSETRASRPAPDSTNEPNGALESGSANASATVALATSSDETPVSPLISSLVTGQQNTVLEEVSDPRLVLEEIERRALLDAGADEYARKVRPANTSRAYERAWDNWKKFCAHVGLPTTPASRGMLAGYVRWRWDGSAAPTTIDTELGGIATGLRDRGHPVDRELTQRAREILKAEQRREAEAGGLPRGRGKAPAITVPQLWEMSNACPDDLAGLRDRALLLIGFSIAARRSEISGLLCVDVTTEAEGLLVRTRYGKKGGRTVTVTAGRRERTDPVSAWLAWLEVAELEPTDRAVQWIDQWGKLRGGMSPGAIGNRITACAERAGLTGITGHSLRSGLATSARRANRPIESIADQGGWKRNSASLLEYIRSVDRWADSATADIGL